MAHKVFTVRLPEDQAAELERVAQVDGASVAEEIREAITVRIAERRSDPAFQERLRKLIEENQKILEKLAR
jgi:hypothetical protein